MIVSGGKLLAISKVSTDAKTVSGDGVKDPIGITSDYISNYYYVVSGSKNIAVTSSYSDDRRHITYGISASDGVAYTGGNYIKVDNSIISLDDAIVASASSGYQAMEIINENRSKWEEGVTYTAGDNISIDATKKEISGRDWTPELNDKLDNSWSTDTFEPWQRGINTWSAGVEASAATLSGYISNNEDKWLNSAYLVESETPSILTVKSAYNADNRVITYSLSAKETGEGATYEAGDWIDSDKLKDENIISVSGYKTLKTKHPLYFSTDEDNPNTIWLLHAETSPGDKSTKICVICNGWQGDASSSNYTNDESSLNVTVPSKPDSNFANVKYTFHFGRPMAIQININAKFVVRADAKDKIGTVGFGGVTFNGKQMTNEIEYTMLGALKEQYYAASTITRIDSDANGEFPAAGVDLEFNFIGDDDFLNSIDTPCISIHEIVGEA